MERSREKNKLTLPCLVEDYSSEDRITLIKIINKVFFDFNSECTGVYILGSSCFGNSPTTDIDILCVSPDAKTDIRQVNNYDRSSEIYRMSMDIRKSIQSYFNNRLDLLVGDGSSLKLHSTDLGFQIPYFHVNTGKLFHKQPGAKIPFHFQWDNERRIFKTMMRDKTTPAISLLF